MKKSGTEETANSPYATYSTSSHNESCLYPSLEPISQPNMDNEEHDIVKYLSLSNSLVLEKSSDQSFLPTSLEEGTRTHYNYDN